MNNKLNKDQNIMVNITNQILSNLYGGAHPKSDQNFWCAVASLLYNKFHEKIRVKIKHYEN